jgi:hypothetical protein
VALYKINSIDRTKSDFRNNELRSTDVCNNWQWTLYIKGTCAKTPQCAQQRNGSDTCAHVSGSTYALTGRPGVDAHLVDVTRSLYGSTQPCGLDSICLRYSYEHSCARQHCCIREQWKGRLFCARYRTAARSALTRSSALHTTYAL